MKLNRMVFTFLAMAFANQVMADAVQCRNAEAALAEVSNIIAESYNSTDMEKAVSYGKKITSQIDAGSSASTTCGCGGVKPSVAETRTLVEDAMKQKDLENIQNILSAAITKSESARVEAEKCWRAAEQAKK